MSLSIVLCVGSGCASKPAIKVEEKQSRLPELGNHSFKVTTQSREAQHAFDRGLTLAYGFGHYAAEQEFRRAVALDPQCAMAWWGITAKIYKGTRETGGRCWAYVTRFNNRAKRTRQAKSDVG